jgi:molecular chaperone DnaK (HSP70)
MHGDWPFLAEEAKYSTCVPSVDNNKRVGFEIDYKGERDFYYPEQVMGVYFDKLKQNWIKAGYDTRDVVVSVPDYFSAHERKAMIDAIAIADLNCTSLVSESTAIALNYGLFRRAQFDDTKPRIVAFVDIGHATGSVFFASFTKNHQKVISVTHERFCGAREFDYLIMEHVSNVFKQKYGSNPMNNPKCRMRLIDAIMKTRKILTSNREAPLNVECLIDDDDLNYMLTRDEFEKIIEPVLNKMRNLFVTSITNAASEGKFNIADLHSVEMVGDAVRTPIVQQIVKDIFGLELSKTLMPDETLARGATLYAAMNSPFFSMKDFTFENYNPFSIILEYPFSKDGQIQIRQHKIIGKGEIMPNKKSIKFTEKQLPKLETVNLKFYYNKEELPYLTESLLESCMVSVPQVKEEQYSFVIHFYLDSSGIPHLDKATINEFYYEEVKHDKKEEKKEGEDKSKKEKSTICSIKIAECNFGVPQNVLDNFVQKEANQEIEDRQHVFAVNKRNEIENFIYTTRMKLENELIGYISNEEKDLLVNLMARAEEWFYSGDEAIYNKATIESQTKELNDLGSKIYKRFYDWNKLGDALASFDKVLNALLNVFNEKYALFTKGQGSLNQQDCQEITTMITNANNQLNEWRTQAATLPKHMNPPVLSENVSKIAEEMTKV